MENGNNLSNPARTIKSGSSLLDVEKTLCDTESLFSVKANQGSLELTNRWCWQKLLGSRGGIVGWCGSREAELLAADLPVCKSLTRALFFPGRMVLGWSRVGRNRDDVQMLSPGCRAAAVSHPAIPLAGICFPWSCCCWWKPRIVTLSSAHSRVKTVPTLPGDFHRWSVIHNVFCFSSGCELAYEGGSVRFTRVMKSADGG